MSLKDELIAVKNALQASAYNYNVHFCTPENYENHMLSITEATYRRSMFEQNSYTNIRTQIINFDFVFCYADSQDQFDRIEQQSSDYNNLETVLNTRNSSEGFQWVITDANKSYDEEKGFHLLTIEVQIYYRISA